ncbi:MAG: Transcriptional regulator, AraC family [Collimonas fungivorans]|nr:Transcriptional regulator, AraC family [Collimonas fungivorans]
MSSYQAASKPGPQPTPMLPQTAAPAPVVHFGFLTLPNFSMIAFASAIEVLRMANYISRQTLYRWSVISVDGAPALASNGLPITPTLTLEQAGTPDILFVCGGVKIHEAVNEKLNAMLTQLARRNVKLGGICTGSYALVKAGLMNGYQCAIHWENISALREEFPRVLFTEGLFAVDRDRLTCSGGTAPIDLMLNLTANRYGKTLAAEISEQFILERIRDGAYQQHIPIAARLGFSRKELIEVARLMETHIEETLSFEEIARLVGLSQRQLQRMFKYYLDVTPTHYYLQLRLRRARELLLQTTMSIMSVTVACGFQSSCHFSKAYRNQFGRSPSSERHLRHPYLSAVDEMPSLPGLPLAVDELLDAGRQ